MITPLAFVFLLGTSAVFGDKMSCVDVQGLINRYTVNLSGEEFSCSNFNTGVYFQRVPVDNPLSSQNVVVVKPGQNPPRIDFDNKTYKLHELKVSPFHRSDAEKAAIMRLLFSENGYGTYDTSLQILVPLILTEDKEDRDRNPYLTTDLTMMGDLPEAGIYKVNSIEWLTPLLKTAQRVSTMFGSTKSFMTDCETVPMHAVKDFLKPGTKQRS